MWFILDAFGVALGLLTWCLLGFTDWVVCKHTLATLFASTEPRIRWLPYTDAGCIVFFLYQSLISLSFISHVQAMTTDPGTITQSKPPPEFQNTKWCTLCREGQEERWKPPRAHHCKTCKRCIFRMDHHCPWVNNCVGFSNQKLFILFLGYTAVSAIVTVILLVSSGVYWLWSQKSMAHASSPGSFMMICSGVAALVCLAAILFVSDFLQEQIESIQQNSTLVETYQRTHGERSNFWAHWKGVFGYNWWLWPWPFRSHPPADYGEPAYPDQDSTDGFASFREEDSLGIAGTEYEAADSTMAADGSATAGARHGSAPRPRHRYGGGDAPE